jgi:hypothetical protein
MTINFIDYLLIILFPFGVGLYFLGLGEFFDYSNVTVHLLFGFFFVFCLIYFVKRLFFNHITMNFGIRLRCNAFFCRFFGHITIAFDGLRLLLNALFRHLHDCAIGFGSYHIAILYSFACVALTVYFLIGYIEQIVCGGSLAVLCAALLFVSLYQIGMLLELLVIEDFDDSLLETPSLSWFHHIVIAIPFFVVYPFHAKVCGRPTDFGRKTLNRVLVIVLFVFHNICTVCLVVYITNSSKWMPCETISTRVTSKYDAALCTLTVAAISVGTFVISNVIFRVIFYNTFQDLLNSSLRAALLNHQSNGIKALIRAKADVLQCDK